MTRKAPVSQHERFATMTDAAERGQILQQHLTDAEKRFRRNTGQRYYYFGIEAVTYYADWLGAIAPELTIEFLQALAAVHGAHDKEKYHAARLRLKQAKMALHVHFGANDTKRGVA